ncbi:probable RNA-dependent RNA polymerase 1 [Nymphaea colorata]|nr:probable RNA-dependent RNA polymerase 1 [Nymphaea colorata]XP_031492050.1 probable RNA-dependent RNA polymerase 1 [Nymphaea colorata]XP_031492051.1 probable RNA-dependent RNA polymerase 1 [Nymphaea colorata]XP_031492052.1 probable RNA-dependent RNA polymerase 1 [Nymphaea colorata]
MGGRSIQVSGFPAGVDADTVKNFLESYTGSGTVYACKVREPKQGRSKRVFAMVQFTTKRDAELITSLAQPRALYYGSSYLTARNLERDVVPQPRTPFFSLEKVVLHFGCLISKQTYYILYTKSIVKVEFGFGLRRIYFFLACGDVEYKLDLYYENVWQVQLRHQRGVNKRYLLFQLQGAPRIFVKPVCITSAISRMPILDFFKDLPDDQWIRTTDFTPLCSIGQSSAVCLEIPDGSSLPDIREYFAHYKDVEGEFTLQQGFSYSCGLSLVPVVKPPNRIRLPFKILFKINYLVHFGYLVGPTLTDEFYHLLNPSVTPLNYIELALEKLSQLTDCSFEPEKWLKAQFRKFSRARYLPKSAVISLEPGLVYVHRVQVTPSKVYFYGPEINVSNHVIRQYPDEIENFLRLSFIDEDLEKIRSFDLSRRTTLPDDQKSTFLLETMLSSLEITLGIGDNKNEFPAFSSSHVSQRTTFLDDQNHTPIYRRVLSTLEEGIVIGDKKFEFLAFSSSQLRDNSLWMFASHPELTAADIRRKMGDFSSIRNIAKYAARVGQSLSSSTETLKVPPSEVENIPDVKSGQYVFSDGIGKISSAFARKVAEKCSCNRRIPSAFQIRYGGYKGVVAVDPTSNFKLSLRKSMCKYMSNDTHLNVLAWTKYQPCFLNRQIINLLSTLGVEDRIFEIKQKEALDQLDKILIDAKVALEAIELMAPSENMKVLTEMLHCGYMPNSEPFLSMMLETFRATKLLELRRKARVFVPEGRSMMGCMDETRSLDYGQVFVQYSGAGDAECQCTRVVEGLVVVAKNPCLHPGDVRVLWATNIPALHHMVDCIVFPQKGRRPHPNECSGSDLDGDVYFVSWDPALIPPRQIPPMDYDPAPPEDLGRDVLIKDVQEYFANYMINDSLGIISNAHTVFADKEPMKAQSLPCIELAKLFSVAVDFPKTGVPAVIPSHLRVQEYPDFMEKPDKPTYESRGIIGKLFRAVKGRSQVASIASFTKSVACKAYDRDLEVDGYEDYLDDAYYYKSEYDLKLWNLMQHYGFKTEAEIMCGNVMFLSGSFRRNRDSEAILLAVRSLRKEARAWFAKESNRSEQYGDDYEDDPLAKASAWYHVTYHPDYWGAYSEENQPHFISFPWCVYDKLITIKKEKLRSRKTRAAQLKHHVNSLML